MNHKKESNNPMVEFKYALDKQAKNTLKYLSKDSLLQAVKEDSKIFFAHKMPKG